jgi:hypothetical protein
MDDRTRDFLENHKACKGYVLPTNGKDGKEPDFEMIKRQRGTKNWKDHPDSFCERPATREEVKEWAAAEGVGIAAITGERSGLVALDIDFPRKELVEMLLCGVAPDTPAAKSPGGGGSFLFRFSPEFKHYEIRCPVFNEKTIPGTTEANTLYIGRSHLGAFQVGKYIVLPPGPGREWLPGYSPDEVETAEVPQGLLEVLGQFDINHAAAAGDNDNDQGKLLIEQDAAGEITNTGQGYNIGILVSDTYSCPTEPAYREILNREIVESLSRDEGTAVSFLQKLGADITDVGTAFHCIRHQDTTPSAALFRPRHTGSDGLVPDGRILYVEFHAGGETVTLGQVYCELKTGQLFASPQQRKKRHVGRWDVACFAPGEAAAWYVRGLHDLLGYQLPPLPCPVRELPPDAPEKAMRVYAAFVLLLRVRQTYEPGGSTAPYSWRFASRWSGTSKSSAERAVRWLFENGYLTSKGKTATGTNLMSLKREQVHKDCAASAYPALLREYDRKRREKAIALDPPGGNDSGKD